ncbi:tRNA preQ1(34) S-adenosylmethionine ribosyltransferase-isomerase QueA [Candidatus Woesearchaeota archaeon CG_4_10_14_0_2_um_filter_33_13]|nr:MAG: tRNA preQ1(34) S-adenosylmethionine ribosyltransferase-isomerase QueA [Candidatus Woesearchaeota archaeon CG_4_10_14_0_2_um_filter_33_13]
MNLEDYNYHLPEELIAQKAFYPRDHCKLMVIKEDKFLHQKFYEIIDFLQHGDVLVINETKVRRCKLIGKKETGSPVEVTLVKHLGNNFYETRIKGKPKVGKKLIFVNLTGKIIKQEEDCFYVQFDREIREEECQLLTPPYIKEDVPEEDYQTTYAKVSGSLAAPTAGLHFTPELLRKIESKGVKIARLQLDISYSTFLSIRDIKTHQTGKEYFSLDNKNAEIINSAKGNIIAVGTTVVKCLESCNWENNRIKATEGISEIFIKPGHQFKAPLKAMLTNFHLPKSSLLLLTSAYAGREQLLKAYNEAVKKKYRFFSLGDAMLIFK